MWERHYAEKADTINRVFMKTPKEIWALFQFTGLALKVWIMTYSLESEALLLTPVNQLSTDFSPLQTLCFHKCQSSSFKELILWECQGAAAVAEEWNINRSVASTLSLSREQQYIFDGPDPLLLIWWSRPSFPDN